MTYRSLSLSLSWVLLATLLLILGGVPENVYSGQESIDSGSGSMVRIREITGEGCHHFYFDEDPKTVILTSLHAWGTTPINIKAFFNHLAVKRLMDDKRVKITQLCFYDDASTIAFIAYRQYEESNPQKKPNNIIGLVRVWPRKSFKKIEKFVPSSGDIGVCGITGSIEGNIIYSCGGGDGPGGFSSTYILNRKTGKETTIKDCTYGDSGDGKGYQATCKANLLSLPEVPLLNGIP